MISIDSDPHIRRWTRSEYYSMNEIGLFEGQHVELIEGEIIVSSAQSSSQNSSITKVARTAERVFGAGFWVRIQMAMLFSDSSEPEPDVSVVPGTEDDYKDHPPTAVLVVEVSGSSLKNDRTRKAALYAKAGIEDYWIVNLWGRCMEVFRTPTRDSTGNFYYENVQTIDEHGFVSPLAKPNDKIAVADLLPLNK